MRPTSAQAAGDKASDRRSCCGRSPCHHNHHTPGLFGFQEVIFRQIAPSAPLSHTSPRPCGNFALSQCRSGGEIRERPDLCHAGTGSRDGKRERRVAPGTLPICSSLHSAAPHLNPTANSPARRAKTPNIHLTADIGHGTRANMYIDTSYIII